MIPGIMSGQMAILPGGPSDAYWSYVVSALHFDGSDSSTTFTDEKSKTWSAASGAKLSTSNKKFGTAALICNGTTDGVLGAASTDFDFGTGDLTIEAWVYISGDSPADYDGAKGASIISTWNSGFAAGDLKGWNLQVLGTAGGTGTGIGFDTWGGTSTATLYRSTATVSKDTWHHVAVTVASGVRRLFLDGVLLSGTTTTLGAGYTQANSQGSPPTIGYTGRATYYPQFLNGCIDDVRVTKGVARYTSTFTPPSEPFIAN